MTSTVADNRSAFHRAISFPQNIEAIASFIPAPSAREVGALPVLCKKLETHFFLKGFPFQYSAYRYPLSPTRFREIETQKEIFEAHGRNPLYLRELLPSGGTAAWEAFKMNNFEFATLYLNWGGLLAVTKEQKEELCKCRSLRVDWPAISAQIRNARWEAADTSEKKQAMLQATLEEYCLKGRSKEMEWVFLKARANGISLSPIKPLENAIRGGLQDIIAILCDRLDVKNLKNEEKLALVNMAVEMGYPELLPHLQKFGFPVSKEHENQMEELQFVQKGLAPYVAFPRPPNAAAHSVHGGNTNLSLGEKEYLLTVGYAYNALRSGMNIRTLIENLQHRRRRSALLGNLGHVDHYGIPTSGPMCTVYGGSYKEFGDRIGKKYTHFPVQVTATIGDRVIPMTKLLKEGWDHPDGSHREVILDEVARLCEPLRTTLQEDLSTPVSPIVFLVSHYPPCERGTPLVLRALVDALCLHQRRDPIHPGYEINCDALVFDKPAEFLESFKKQAPLPLAPKKDPVFAMKGCLREPSAPIMGLI